VVLVGWLLVVGGAAVGGLLCVLLIADHSGWVVFVCVRLPARFVI